MAIDHHWFTLGSEIIGLFLIKQQSSVVGRRCDDVFDPFCQSGPFKAPIWQTIITLIAQLGCLSWWATERVIGTNTANISKLDGVTDAFSDLVVDGPPPPTWAYALTIVPAFLTTSYLLIFYIALQSVRASTALILMMPGYLVELLFDAYTNYSSGDGGDSTCNSQLGKNLQLPITITITTTLAWVLAAWDEISESLRQDAGSLAGAFTNTGARSATAVASPDIVVISVLFGVAAGALLALRNIIFRGMLDRFEIDRYQALGLEGVFGLITAFTMLIFADAWKLEYSGITLFQIFTSNYLTYSTVLYVGLWLIICLLPHRAAVDYVYRTVGVIIVEWLFGGLLESSMIALAARGCVIVTAALIWMVEPLQQTHRPSLFVCARPPQTPPLCGHRQVMSEKRHSRCPLCVRGLD